MIRRTLNPTSNQHIIPKVINTLNETGGQENPSKMSEVDEQNERDEETTLPMVGTTHGRLKSIASSMKFHTGYGGLNGPLQPAVLSVT